jgi:hypothetical protein
VSPPRDDEEFFDEDEAQKEGRGFVPEFVRKMAVAGMGALFMTEEGLRGLASQLKLPKDVLTYVLAQAQTTKDDISRVVSEELRRFLQSEKLRDEFLKLLSGMTVEVTSQIRLVPTHERKGKPPSASPEVKITHLAAKPPKRKKE